MSYKLNNAIIEHEEQKDSKSGDAQSKISEKKLKANRENAGKSTGPRTPEGKRRSRMNSFKHGMLANRVIFDKNGQPSPGFQHVYEALRTQYATGDVATDLQIELLFTDYWRLAQATAAQAANIRREGSDIIGYDWIQKVQRYATANRNSFMKTLDFR